MGQICSLCTRKDQVPKFSGRHKGKKHITNSSNETDLKSSLSMADSLNETQVTLSCFENGEFVVGFRLIAEVKRGYDGKLSYNGWNAIGDNDQPQPLWTREYPNIAAVLYTVESSDRKKIKSAKSELHKFVSEEHFEEFYLLIFCNQDRNSDAMDAREVEQKLNLSKLKNCTDYRVQPSIGSKGCGFQCGLVWLFDLLEKRYHGIDASSSPFQEV